MKIYTDGACSGNPGPGGWAFVVEHQNGYKAQAGRDIYTTNNKMELEGVIQALIFANSCNNMSVSIYCDSVYVVNGINSWMKGWKKNNWLTSAKKPVANQEYWLRVDRLLAKHISVFWVKGHAGTTGNNMADRIATCFAQNDTHDCCICSQYI